MNRTLSYLPIPLLLLALVSCSDSTTPPKQDNLQLTVTAGNSQTGEPSAALPNQITIRVDRIESEPVGIGPAEGVEVVWTAQNGGSATPARSTTNAQGLASTSWTLGPAEGAQTMSAVDASGFADAVTITATALAGGCPTTGGTAHSGVISAPETWGPGLHRVTGQLSVDSELEIQAGAMVCVAAGQKIEFRNQGYLKAIGTPEKPIVFTTADSATGWQGLRFISIGSGPSFINDVRIYHSTFGILAESPVHQVRIYHTLVRGAKTSALTLRGIGSDVTASTFDGTSGGDFAVTLGLEATSGQISFEGTVRNAFAGGITAYGASIFMSRVEVTGSGGDAIVVPVAQIMGSVHIDTSNLFGNAGVGLRNLGTTLVDAKSNWWGDPAGPNGPNGDGVAGNVDTSFSLIAPATFDPRP